MRRSPVIADWLLDNLGVSRRNEALMGDISEEYASGRSRLWYWRQSIAAIRLTVIKDLRNHPLLIARSLVVWIAYGGVTSYALNALTHWIQFDSPWRSCTPLIWADVALFYFTAGFGAWLAVRMHRRQKAAVLGTLTRVGVVWDFWHFTRHYDELHRMPVANQFTVDLVLSLIALLCAIVGGWVSPAGEGERQSRTTQI